jgi:hypothetical protein
MAPFQQFDPEHILERSDLAAYCGLRDAKVLSCLRDAHAATDGNEAADEIERR